MEHNPHNAQNWCPDPFGQHEARWFSNGIPTALVRDRGVEAQDPPPEPSFARRFELRSIEPHDPPVVHAHRRFALRRSQVGAG
jgi:hypothetical protein